MNKGYISLVALLATPAFAEETRQLDAHEHGVGELTIAADGNAIAIELHAPGADIVGFEHPAESDEDRAAIEAAIATLANPFDLFEFPAGAECTVTETMASLESEAEHDDHDHDDHDDHSDHDDHDDHEEHADHDDHDEHDHDEHADHDDHDKHDDHDDHAGHDDHDDHDDHDEAGSNHTEFHAEYMLNCANPAEIATIAFPYFDLFENALELEIQLATTKGANAFEVERDAPSVDVSGMF